MSKFRLKKYQELEQQVLSNKAPIQNFPKLIDFPFPKHYKNIVTQIKTTAISADCVLFSAVEAVIQTQELGLESYWCFAQDGQGNRWLFDDSGLVHYSDHDQDQGVASLQITFEQWIQMADLASQLDAYIDLDKVTESVRDEFTALLQVIHPHLNQNYPYTI